MLKTIDKRYKKVLATMLVAIMILSQINILALAQDEGAYKITLYSKPGCMLYSAQEMAKKGDIITINVEYEGSFDFQGIELMGEKTGRNIEYENSSNSLWFEMPNESVVATPIGFDISSEINVKEIQIKSEGFHSLEAYILNNASMEYLNEINETADITTYLSTMQTMAKIEDFPDPSKELTIDNLFASSDTTGTPWVRTMVDSTIMFDVGTSNEYYVAYIDISHFTEGTEILDYAFGRNNTSGELVEGCILDKESGLAYIPKYLCEGNGENGDQYIRVQVLYLYENREIVVPVEVRNNTSDTSINQSGFAHLSIDDFTTTIQLAKHNSDIKGKIYLAVNGIPVQEENYRYDKTQGALIIDTPSLSVTSITVLVNESKSTYSTVLGSDWKEIQGVSIELSKTPTTGELFNFTSQKLVYYASSFDEASLDNYGYTYQPVNASGGTLWADINDYFDAFYTGTVKLSSSGYTAITNSSQVNSSWNPINEDYKGIALSYNKSSATSTKGTTMTVISENDLVIQIPFYCTHLSSSSAYGGAVEDYANAADGSKYYGVGYVRGTVISTAGLSDGYIIMGFVHQTMYSQAGVCYARIGVEPTTGLFSLKKESTTPDITEGSDCYTLEGAQYGVYTTKDGAMNNISSLRVGTLMTDVTGSSNSLELNAGTYYVKELEAPKGYQLDSEIYTVVVKSDDTTVLSVKDAPHYDPIGMVVTKVDADTGEGLATGSGVLAGAQFAVNFYNTHGSISDMMPTRTWVFETDEEGLARYNELYKLEGEDLYYFEGVPYLPLGTITIQETKAPTGYLVDPTTYTRVIELDETLDSVVVENVPVVEEQVIRGDLELIKIEGTSMRRMEGIPFQITSQTTGESYTIVTDVNGYASTHSDWNPHSQYTNRGETSEDGVWFGEIGALDDGKGALPYDTYIIEELPCENNTDHFIIDPFTIVISRAGYTVNLGTITNDAKPIVSIDSMANDSVTESHVGLINDEITIFDDVMLSGLTVGVEYRIEGILMNKSTQAPFYTHDEKLVESEELKYPTVQITMGEKVNTTCTFVASNYYEVHTLEYNFKGTDITQVTDIVVFEYVYVEDELVVEHADFEDMDQTVTYANTSVGTKASAPQYYEIGEVAEVKDLVMYENVIPDTCYSIEGILMDKETEEPFVINGDVVTSTLEFVPDNNEGEIELSFPFEITEDMGNLNLVVFETLYNEEGYQVAEHTDINDEDQTVLILAMDIDIDIPKTGDDSNVIWLVQLMFLSMFVGIITYKRYSLRI